MIPRVLIVLLLLIPVLGASEPRGKCMPPNDPKLAKLRADAEADAKAAADRGLSNAGLVVLSYGTKRIELYRGVGGNGGVKKEKIPGAVGTMVTYENERFLVGPTYWGLSGQAPWPPELVLDSAGTMHVVTRTPRRTSQHVKVCGCRPPKCGPYGSGCPACGSTVQNLYGPLPKDATLGEPVSLTYDQTVIEPDYASGDCKTPCPPPPPSMAR